MYMKHVNHFLVVVMALALTIGGCGRKEKEGNISTSGSPATTTSGSVVDTKVLPERAEDGTLKSKEELDEVPVAEQIRQLNLNNAVLLASIALYGSSYVVDKHMGKIASYGGYLSSIPERTRLRLNYKTSTTTADGKAIRYKYKVMEEFDKDAFEAARKAYRKALSEAVAGIKGAHPELTTGGALKQLNKRSMQKPMLEKLAEIEKRYLQEQVAGRLPRINSVIKWGAKGMRAAAIFGGVFFLYESVANAKEVSADEVTFEQKLDQLEEALRNHEHDNANIHWQNEVIRIVSENFPHILASLETRVGVLKAQIAGMSSDSSTLESLNSELTLVEGNIVFVQSTLNQINSEGTDEEKIQIISENMAKIAELFLQ